MLDRQRREYDITYVFSLLSTNITFNSQQSKLDINKVMETVLAGLLNKIFKTNLINLNVIKHNHPAIDLGDAAVGEAFQVTSDGSKDKFESTIDMFKKHNLDTTYKKITFLIISNDQKINFTRAPFNIVINNLSDIAKKICELETDRFVEVYTYCESNFSVYFPRNNRSILEPTMRLSVDPSPSISNFLNANCISEAEEHIKCTENDMRNQLINLKDKLSEMGTNQRYFIFNVMKWAMGNVQEKWVERCYIPRVVLENSFDNADKNAVHDICESLFHIGFACYEEYISAVESDGFYVYFNNEIPEEFDYLAGIVNYLKMNDKKENLRNIVVDLDFSFID